MAAGASGHDDARELARLVGECTAASIGRSALALRLSRLPRDRAEPHHLRLARAALDPLLAADRARLFSLDNHDIVVVWKGDASAAVAACRREIAHLFADDTTERSASELGAPPPGDLVQSLTLPDEGRAMLAIVEESLAPHADSGTVEEPPAPPLDLARLAMLELSLQQADLARFARRRPVCAATPQGGFDVAWEKRFLSIEELTAALLPDRSVRADPWLFRRLTRTLDRRMLVLLSHPEELRRAGPFSLNLNVTSILSAEFLRFDAALPARLRGEVVLELSPPDVMADPSAFQFAREFARVRGYGLLLRGLTPILLRMFAREALGVQFLQLRWTADLVARPAPLADADPSCVVLGRADTPAAIGWGRSQGIRHFRGLAAQPT